MAVSRKIPESLLTCLHCSFGELQILEEIGKLCSEGFRPVLLRAEAVVFPAIRTNSHPHPGACLYHGSNPSPVCRELQSNQRCSMSLTWVFLSGFTAATVVQWQLCTGEGQSFVAMADFWDSSQRIFFENHSGNPLRRQRPLLMAAKHQSILLRQALSGLQSGFDAAGYLCERSARWLAYAVWRSVLSHFDDPVVSNCRVRENMSFLVKLFSF